MIINLWLEKRIKQKKILGIFEENKHQIYTHKRVYICVYDQLYKYT
jgi:hypothetical protein